MKKCVSLKQRLISSVLVLVMLFASLIGTTFAWFTDTVTSSGNKIVSGSLKVDLELFDEETNQWNSVKDSNDSIFTYAKWEPGFTEVKLLKVQNEGSLALKWKAVFVSKDALSELADVIDVYVLPYGVLSDEDAATTVVHPDRSLNGYTYAGTLSSFIETIEATTYGSLKEGESAYLGLALKMKESAGNEYQKMDIGGAFDIMIVATQDSAESDSFDNGYDSNVPFPLTPGMLYTAKAAVTADENNKVASEVKIGENDAKGNATVPAGALLEEGATELTFDLSVAENSEAVLEMTAGDAALRLDVHVSGISKNNTQPILVTLNELFPADLTNGNIAFYHVENGKTVPMIQVGSMAELDAHNEFYYDTATGVVTLAMASFSEVSAVVDAQNPWNGTDIDTSWYNAADTEFTLTDTADLAGFAQIVGGMANGIERDSFAGKTVKLGADMNMGSSDGAIFTPVGYYFTDDYNGNGTPSESKDDIFSDVYSFEGTFDGQGHTVSNIYQNTWEIKGDDKYYNLPSEQYYKDGMGLFGFVYNGTVKNLAMYNFQSDGEFCTTGCVAAYAAGVSNFENIRITKCNPRSYNVPNGGVVGYAYDEAEAAENKITFTNVTVDPTTKISALWGSWDVGCGGILGRLGDTTKLTMTNCTVGAIMDVYNDVCANYQYYQFRYCGMLVGTLGSDGNLDDQLANATFNNVSVYYGDWSNNYHYYCELVENSPASYTHDYQFSRLNMIKSVGEIKSGDTWTKTGNFVLVENGVATCYHIRKDESGNLYQHNHEDEGYETVDGSEVLVEDKQVVHIPFNQLFSGYGWGADHGVTLANVQEAKYTVTFMNSTGDVLDVYYVNDNTAELILENIDDTARDLLGMTDEDFGGWVTVGAVETSKIPANNTANYSLYATHATEYTARWVDEDGNVIATQSFNKNNYTENVKEYDVAEPASKSDYLTFGYWAVRESDKTSTPLTEYDFANASGDITIYPYYNLISDGNASMTLQGVDEDGDGQFDHYVVTGVLETDANVNVEIPDYINGLPVVKVTGGAFAEFDNITTVKIPVTITEIGADAFANKENSGMLGSLKYEQITFLYEGTYEQWQAIEKVANWDQYVGEGSRIYFLADGTYSEETARNGTWFASDREWSEPVAGTYGG